MLLVVTVLVLTVVVPETESVVSPVTVSVVPLPKTALPEILSAYAVPEDDPETLIAGYPYCPVLPESPALSKVHVPVELINVLSKLTFPLLPLRFKLYWVPADND